MARKYQLHGAFPSKAGDSAYEVALKNGFEGTEQEWLTSLNGADGYTPYIGDNGNWFIGETDTGMPSRGEDAPQEAILYTPQALTTEQQVQARQNIGAIEAPETAEAGQTIVVKEVDENGKPTAWEAADLAAGGGGHTMDDFETLIDFTAEQTVTEFNIPVDTAITEKINNASDIYLQLRIPRDVDNEDVTTTGKVTIKAYVGWSTPLLSDKVAITPPSATYSKYGELHAHWMRHPFSCADALIINSPDCAVICIHGLHNIYVTDSQFATLSKVVDIFGGTFSSITVTGTQNMYKGTRFILGVKK